MMSHATNIRLILFFATVIGFTGAYKALVYLPLTGHSHMKFMGTVANLLQNDGYDVTLLMPILDNSLKETTPLIRNIKKRIFVETDPRSLAKIDEYGGPNGTRRSLWSIRPSVTGAVQVAQNFSTIHSYQCDGLFQKTSLLADLKAEKFDIAFAEPLYICGFALFDHLNIKTTISTDSHIGLQPVKVAFGDPYTASYVPSSFSSVGDKLNIFGRIKSAIETYLSIYFSETLFDRELALIKDKYKGGKTWQELLSSTAFAFVNSNPLLDFPSPHTEKTISIGGLTIDINERVRPLPEAYDTILSLRRRNVLISFGSNSKSIDMPQEYKDALLTVFESMPDTTFIWKYEDVDSDVVRRHNASISNVVLVDWMPQMELLADPRLDVFVTHGGLGSATELAYRGKPAILVPIFGDQARNARMLERHGAAIMLKKDDLADSKKIREAIVTMSEDKSYVANAYKLASVLHNQPIPPRELFLRYVNFAVRFGKQPTMDSESRHLSFFAQTYLDVFVLLSSFLFVFYQLATRIRIRKIVKQKSD